MGVLSAPVHEHELRIRLGPDQGAHTAAVARIDELATHGRRPLPGDVVLLSVLLEETELVVLDRRHDCETYRPHGTAKAARPEQPRRSSHAAPARSAAAPSSGAGTPPRMRAGTQPYVSICRPVAVTWSTPVTPLLPSSL